MLKRVKFLKEILTLKEFNEIKMDESAFKGSLEMYNEDYIDSVNVFAINNKRFIILKNDLPKLHKDWARTLGELSLNESLINPVYVEVESNGVMLVE
jgi:chromosome segregation ATPase